MKYFLKKYKIQILIGAYAAMVFAVFYWVVMPIVSKISAKANEIEQAKISGELKEERLSSVPVMEENYNKFKENEDNFNIAIEPNSEVELIKELESIAEQTGNKIEFKIQTDADAKAKAKQKVAEDDIKGNLKYSNYLSMMIAIEGDHNGLDQFIHKIENYKKTINVISISSEKKEVLADASELNPVSATSNGVDVINSIFDVVVYIKK